MTITVKRDPVTGRIHVNAGGFCLVVSENTALVFSDGLRRVAVNRPAALEVIPETDRQGAELREL